MEHKLINLYLRFKDVSTLNAAKDIGLPVNTVKELLELGKYLYGRELEKVLTQGSISSKMSYHLQERKR